MQAHPTARSSLATITLSAEQAGHVTGRILAELPVLVGGGINDPANPRDCINNVRATLDHCEASLSQLDRVDDDGIVSWTAFRPQIAAVAVDLLAIGLDDAVVTDILEHGADALEHSVSREWLSMAETALAIRDQLAAVEAVS